MFQFTLEGPNSDLQVAVWPCCICTGSWPFLTPQPSSFPKHLSVVSGSSIDSDTKPHMHCFFCFHSYVRLNAYDQCPPPLSIYIYIYTHTYAWTSQVELVVKNPTANADVGSIHGLGRSPGGGNGNPLHSLAWRIPWTEEPGGLQSIGSQRVRHGWSELAHIEIHIYLSWLSYFSDNLKKSLTHSVGSLCYGLIKPVSTDPVQNSYRKNQTSFII